MSYYELKTDTNIEARLVKLLENERLSDRDKSFLSSLLDSFKHYKGLTPKQYSAMERKEEIFKPENIAKFEEWKEVYFSTEREATRIIAKYYLNSESLCNDSKIRHWGTRRCS